MTSAVYRRAPRLVAYWRGPEFVLHPYLNGPAYIAGPEIVEALHLLSTWTSAPEYAKAVGVNSRAAARLLEWLERHRLVERQAQRSEPPETAWDTWGDAAGFLHFSTRNKRFLSSRAAHVRLRQKAASGQPPPPTKRYPGNHRTLLAPLAGRSSFDSIVLARRTWRRFGPGAVSLADLTAILELTFKAQSWVDLGVSGPAMLRTSPSGGARHPTEAYVLVRAIRGLRQGAYYYAPAEHALVTLTPRRVTGAEITRYLAGQSWYARAAAIVFLTAVFERTAWLYPSANAYHSILLEAGHFCQTFCLAATARRLAPFCTAAFAATPIERALGLDAVRESVMYVAGFGVRPPGMRWAPLPEGEDGLGG
jgi:SagB-type dehydrogenase family enzyme